MKTLTLLLAFSTLNLQAVPRLSTETSHIPAGTTRAKSGESVEMSEAEVDVTATSIGTCSQDPSFIPLDNFLMLAKDASVLDSPLSAKEINKSGKWYYEITFGPFVGWSCINENIDINVRFNKDNGNLKFFTKYKATKGHNDFQQCLKTAGVLNDQGGFVNPRPANVDESSFSFQVSRLADKDVTVTYVQSESSDGINGQGVQSVNNGKCEFLMPTNKAGIVKLRSSETLFLSEAQDVCENGNLEQILDVLGKARSKELNSIKSILEKRVSELSVEQMKQGIALIDDEKYSEGRSKIEEVLDFYKDTLEEYVKELGEKYKAYKKVKGKNSKKEEEKKLLADIRKIKEKINNLLEDLELDDAIKTLEEQGQFSLAKTLKRLDLYSNFAKERIEDPAVVKKQNDERMESFLAEVELEEKGLECLKDGEKCKTPAEVAKEYETELATLQNEVQTAVANLQQEIQRICPQEQNQQDCITHYNSQLEKVVKNFERDRKDLLEEGADEVNNALKVYRYRNAYAKLRGEEEVKLDAVRIVASDTNVTAPSGVAPTPQQVMPPQLYVQPPQFQFQQQFFPQPQFNLGFQQQQPMFFGSQFAQTPCYDYISCQMYGMQVPGMYQQQQPMQNGFQLQFNGGFGGGYPYQQQQGYFMPNQQQQFFPQQGPMMMPQQQFMGPVLR